MSITRRICTLAATAALVAVAIVPAAAGTPEQPGSAAEHWTQARMDAAIPRDLVIDEQGRGYLRRPDGTLAPYGQDQATIARPQAKPDSPGNGGGKDGGGGGGGGGGSDTDGPDVSVLAPVEGATITASSHEFRATVIDESGVKSVTFVVTGPENNASSYSYSASNVGDNTWAATVSGLTDGSWSWHVEARDGVKRGGNTTTTEPVSFSVALDGGGDGGGVTEEIVTNDQWTGGGTVQNAAGRIYFQMPANGPFWSGYVCSGTVATDDVTGISVIITAAHCVYDDVNKVFARNVLFIPNQAGTKGSGTNTTCSDDPLGCWEPSHGVVDQDWANRTWPDNIPWDYAYYVVPDTDAHTSGIDKVANDALDVAAGSLRVQFDAATQGALTHALGYSYSDDPDFMYCAEGLGTDGLDALWLGNCGLSGGASGGPWLQPVEDGDGPIVSVNSYGYSNKPGMGGPRLTGSASCVFEQAKVVSATTDRGTVVTCPTEGSTS